MPAPANYKTKTDIVKSIKDATAEPSFFPGLGSRIPGSAGIDNERATGLRFLAKVKSGRALQGQRAAK